MAAPARSAALKVEWAKITTSLGLKGSTASALQAFKKRNEDARRKFALLSEQPTEVDFSHYRSVLKNTAVVDQIEQSFKTFKPVKQDITKQLEAIDKFEAQAIKNAEATKSRVEVELKDLQATLANIEEARSFDDLTVDDVVKARPDIDAKVEEMVKKGRWMPPGYKEKFGDLTLV